MSMPLGNGRGLGTYGFKGAHLPRAAGGLQRGNRISIRIGKKELQSRLLFTKEDRCYLLTRNGLESCSNTPTHNISDWRGVRIAKTVFYVPNFTLQKIKWNFTQNMYT